MQRHNHNLTISDLGGMVTDDATVHSAKKDGLDIVRADWAEQNGMKEPLKNPGGWSAKGAPLDALFDKYKHLLGGIEDKMLNLGDDLSQRTPIHEMMLTQHGFPQRSLTPHQKVLARIHAWLAMPVELLVWSVVCRGLCDYETMAEMRGISVQDVKDMCHKHTKLINPLELDGELLPIPRHVALDALAPGSSRIVWEVADSEDRTIPNLEWLLMPLPVCFFIDKSIAMYKKAALTARQRVQAGGSDDEVMKHHAALDLLLQATHVVASHHHNKIVHEHSARFPLLRPRVYDADHTVHTSTGIPKGSPQGNIYIYIYPPGVPFRDTTSIPRAPTRFPHALYTRPPPPHPRGVVDSQGRVVLMCNLILFNVPCTSTATVHVGSPRKDPFPGIPPRITSGMPPGIPAEIPQGSPPGILQGNPHGDPPQ